MSGNANSGRTSKYDKIANVQTILEGSAIEAAAILDRHIHQVQKHKKLLSSLQRACEYVIDHAIGKSRQKIEHSGGIMTYGELAKSAEDLDKKPRPILADVAEIANKHKPAPVSNQEDKEPEGTME